MGCAPSKNVDLSTEVTLYHFDLHRVVGKGAFGKVRHRAHSIAPFGLRLMPLFSGPRRPT